MRGLTCAEICKVDGGSVIETAKHVLKVSAPVRAVAGSALLGWAIGSAIYRTYENEIGAAVDYVFAD